MSAELPDVALDDFGWKAKAAAARDACWAKCNTALALFELLVFKLVVCLLSELLENFSVITL